MKNKLFGMGMILAAVMFFAACGGSSSTTDAAGEDGAGVATVQSLASLPTVDLSQYDSSTTTSANLAALAGKSFGLAKRMGENMQAVGNFSRAGCEANMHKKEVVRMSQMSQLDRCYPEAMETAGFITIPSDGSYALYSITPPARNEEQTGNMCDGIPTERREERDACEAGSEGPGSKGMKMKIGRIGNALQIDMCEGDAGLVNEATYSADGSVYTADVVRIGNWGGRRESNKFAMTVDLGTAGTVTNGIVTLGENGAVSATGQMNGGFGSGRIIFERLGSDSSNKIKGAFAGGFTDPFSGKETSFTGKVYSHFGGATATGCAKFEFTGEMPPMSCANMIPVSIPDAQRDAFIQSFGVELGMVLDWEECQRTFFCPNPNFDPSTASANATVKPMLPLTGDTCGEVINTGVECFAISNATLTTDFGTEVTQTFTIIANAASPFYDEVYAFDLATLTETIEDIAFTRNWDCTGAFTELVFANFTAEQMAAAEDAMQACRALEERGRGNDGMGGYNCGQEEQMNGVNDLAEGGGGQDHFGKFGGMFDLQNPDICTPAPPNGLIVSATNITENKYCLAYNGTCSSEFQVGGDGKATPTEPIRITNGQSVARFAYNDFNNPTTVTVRIKNPDNSTCNPVYGVDKPDFDAPPPPEEGRGCNAATLPPACQTAGITGCEQCGAYCMQPGTNCRPQ